MKTLKILFKVRYAGELYPKEFKELVDVELDSTPEEEEQIVKEYYWDYYIKGNQNVAQEYPYIKL